MANSLLDEEIAEKVIRQVRTRRFWISLFNTCLRIVRSFIKPLFRFVPNSLQQVEFYFSDCSLRSNSFLENIVSEMASLALVCSFKRMREHLNLGDGKVTQGVVRDVAQALRNSASLKISQDGNRVGKATKLLKLGDCITKPPAFNGEDYCYWKDLTRLLLESTHVDLWDIVENGPYTPIPKEQWTYDQKSLVQLNIKAKFFLTCALSRSEYDKIYGCRTAKEMWDTLVIIHEGTKQVKKVRSNMLIRQYELFEMQDQETIDQMIGRFLSITNGLKSLGREYDNQDHMS
ncbi:La protein 1, partial [Mucuna pruriens]